LHEVRDDFYAAILTKRNELQAAGTIIPDSLKLPVRETFRLWIYSKENWYTYKERYGEKAANARFLGHGQHVKASRILEYVLFDHTQLDVWAIVEDEEGNAYFVERPTLTLAVDLFSRMVLGAELSFEPPSLHNVMACLKEVVRFKPFLEEEFGRAKGATDGWGKPNTIIVDNGWEMVGVSFQTTCEAAGIDVIWAPVKTPQFKAVVERAFRTLNTLVWHRLRGGLPLTPQLRSRLELEPEVKAVHDIRELRYLMWHATVSVYHLEPHTTLGRSPAVVWSASKVRDGRRTVDDPAVFDTLLGQAKRVWLTTKGIELDGQVFHDQRITTELLSRLAKHAQSSGDFEKNLFKSKRIGVLATKDRVDASYVMVWDPSTKRGVRLPNINAEFTANLSWRLIDKIKDFVAKENLAFHSEADMIFARAELSRRMRDEGFFSTYREARKSAPDIDRSDALNPGTKVVHRTIPTIADDTCDVKADTAARHREDSRRPAKGPNRSKPKRRSKRQSPLERNPSKPPDMTAGSLVSGTDSPSLRGMNAVLPTAISDDLMRRLAQEMD
jgi:putative transposase